jgi:hypothetical protein
MKTSPIIWVSIALSTLAVLIAAGIALFVLFSVNKKVAEAPDNVVANQIGIPANTPEQPSTPGNTLYCDDHYAFGFEHAEEWGQPEIFGSLDASRTVMFEKSTTFSYLTIAANPPPFGFEEFETTNTKTVPIRDVQASWSTNTDRDGNHVAFLTFEREGIGYVIILDFGHPFATSDDAVVQGLLDSWVFGCNEPTTTTYEKDLAAARQALTAFFEDLNAGDYAAAAGKISPDTYDFIAGFNSEETDTATLLEFGCEESQLLRCMVIKKIVKQEAVSATEFLFTITFANPDGGTFELGPCCGEDENTPPVSEFDYHVIKYSADDFIILEPPVYHP